MTPINRRILALTIPSIVANITTPLLGLVDTAIVGHMGSAMFIAAIALGGSVFNLLYWCFSFLRAGTSGMTAQAYGANDVGSQALTLWRGLLVAVVIGGVMIALGGVIASLVLDFMGAEGPTAQIALDYVVIVVWGAPAVLANYTLSGWFLGMQDSRSPMWMSIAINLCNIALSVTFALLLGWGVTGLALGTMTAQWIGVALGVIRCRRYRPRWMGFGNIANWVGLSRFFRVNADIFIRTLCLVAVTLWFTRAGSMQGTVILAVNAIIMQLFLLLSYFMDGFAFAGEAIVGRAIGSGDIVELRASVKALMKWGIGVSLLFTVAYAVGGEWFIALLSDDADVKAASADFFWWAVSLPIASFAAFTWDGVYIGATRTRAMLVAMMMALVVYFAIYLWLFPTMGNHGLWAAFVAYLAVRGIAQTVMWPRQIRE